jgi:aquaporin Z
MNPARSIAPAIVSGHLESLWVYIAGPILGAISAAPLHRWLHSPSTKSEIQIAG